jgi:hypothetical protein
VDEPHLDEAGVVQQLACGQRACRLGGLDLDDRWIVELELRPTSEISGPVVSTRGADSLVIAASRTAKFQNGPPTSITLVTPLASHTAKVAGSRALLRATSCAYGTSAVKSAASGRV